MLPESTINDSRPARRFQAGQAERMVRKWNRAWPPGTAVLFWNRFGDPPIETTTRSEAFVAESGVPVVFVQRQTGYVSLFHVLPASERPPGVLLADLKPVSDWLTGLPGNRPPVAEAACEVHGEGAEAAP